MVVGRIQFITKVKILLKKCKSTFLEIWLYGQHTFMVTRWLSSKLNNIYAVSFILMVCKLLSEQGQGLKRKKASHIIIHAICLWQITCHSKKQPLIEGLVDSLAYSFGKSNPSLKHPKEICYVFCSFSKTSKNETQSLLGKWKQPDLSELDQLRVNTGSSHFS